MEVGNRVCTDKVDEKGKNHREVKQDVVKGTVDKCDYRIKDVSSRLDRRLEKTTKSQFIIGLIIVVVVSLFIIYQNGFYCFSVEALVSLKHAM